MLGWRRHLSPSSVVRARSATTGWSCLWPPSGCSCVSPYAGTGCAAGVPRITTDADVVVVTAGMAVLAVPVTCCAVAAVAVIAGRGARVPLMTDTSSPICLPPPSWRAALVPVRLVCLCFGKRGATGLCLRSVRGGIRFRFLCRSTGSGTCARNRRLLPPHAWCFAPVAGGRSGNDQMEVLLAPKIRVGV